MLLNIRRSQAKQALLPSEKYNDADVVAKTRAELGTMSEEQKLGLRQVYAAHVRRKQQGLAYPAAANGSARAIADTAAGSVGEATSDKGVVSVLHTGSKEAILIAKKFCQAFPPPPFFTG